MENVKIKGIKGADPEKKKKRLEIFFGGERDRKRRESEERRSSALFVAVPLFSGQWEFFTYTSTRS